MNEYSPKSSLKSPRAKSTNKSVVLDAGISLHELSSDGSQENDRQIKLPDIILNKLSMTKDAIPLNEIPGLKTTKRADLVKRARTEKKQQKRDFSVDQSAKRNILLQPISQKPSKNRLNTKVMEAWIDDTLQEAEHFDIPGVILKPKQK